MDEIREKLILVGLQRDDGENTEASLQELSSLAATAGAETAGFVIQARSEVHPQTFIGKGKIEEVKELLWELEATGVLFDDELSPTQMKNLEDMLDTKVIDRTILILDIFAQRATSREGKLQVELAQAKYSLTRLQGFGTSMSRLGGGIGTRGPGESKLETDKRRIRERVSQLKKELREVTEHRERTRNERKKREMPVAAIVGYTNAGKSTLLNTLTNAGVLSENKLFATLDPTTRVFSLPNKMNVLLTDTVGFIHKLPHHLIEAFKSTLEEAKYADVIIHVVDASNPDFQKHMEVVYETLKNLGAVGKPVITLFNKYDLIKDKMIRMDLNAQKCVNISATTGLGLSEFAQVLSQVLQERQIYVETLLPFTEGGLLQEIRTAGQLQSEEYREDGVYVKAYVPERIAKKLIK